MIGAVIFDMDGVISDTQHLHAATEVAVLREHGIDLGADEITARYAGVADREFFTRLFGERGLVIDVEAVIADKWRRMMAGAAAVRPMPGAVALIETLRAEGFRLAVASSSPRAFIDHVLGALEVAHHFAAAVSAEEVERGKPEPDVFLRAAARLGALPGECVVIEDAISGMIAARRAGMACIGLVDPARPRDYPADLLVDDLGTLTPERIRALGAARSAAPS